VLIRFITLRKFIKAVRQIGVHEISQIAEPELIENPE